MKASGRKRQVYKVDFRYIIAYISYQHTSFKMRTTFSIVLVVSLSLMYATIAAPVKQKTKSDMDVQLLKSIISHALVQQAAESAGMTKEYCTLLINAMKGIGVAPKENFCDDIDDDDDDDDDDTGIPDGGEVNKSKVYELILDMLNYIHPT